MLSPESEVLLRNSQYFDTGNWLVVNATDPDIFTHFGQPPTGLHQFFDSYNSIRNIATGTHVYGSYLESDRHYDGAIIYWPKSKQHGVMLCHHVSSLLDKEGIILIVGDNKGGIKSANKILEKSGFETQKLDNARHCTLLGCSPLEDNETKGIGEYVNTYSFNILNVNMCFQTLPGAFSSDGLDPGTELLLEGIDSLFAVYKNKENCKVLDFACGNGVIGLSIARLYSNTTVTMTDINSLALHCAKNNISANDIEQDRIKLFSSDILNQVDGKFDVIVSNPPFHSGTKTDYSITEQFLKQAKQHLAPQGRIRIVANRFLKYPDQMQKIFANMKTLTKNSKFSVYESINS